jgi:hypothetical protein
MIGLIYGCFALVRDVHELRKILATYAPSRQNGAGLSRTGTSQVLLYYYFKYSHHTYMFDIFLYRHTAPERYAKIKAKQSLNNVKISLLCFWQVVAPIDLLIFGSIFETLD